MNLSRRGFLLGRLLGDDPPLREPGRPSDSLARDVAPEASAPKAAFRIVTRNCLAWNRSFCSTCVERCPVPGAIRLMANMPQIVTDRCTGCGLCAQVCPAPETAIWRGE